MKLAMRLLGLAALIVLGVWLYTILFPGPEKLIRKRLAKVASLASFGTGEGLIRRAANINELADCFASEIEISVDLRQGSHHELAGRDGIIETAGAARAHWKWLRVEFLDVNPVVASDKQSAVVSLIAKVKTPEDPDFAALDMRVTFKKINGEWRIIRVETIKTLARIRPGRSLPIRSLS